MSESYMVPFDKKSLTSQNHRMLVSGEEVPDEMYLQYSTSTLNACSDGFFVSMGCSTLNCVGRGHAPATEAGWSGAGTVVAVVNDIWLQYWRIYKKPLRYSKQQ